MPSLSVAQAYADGINQWSGVGSGWRRRPPTEVRSWGLQVMRRFVSIALLMASLSTTADAQPIVYGLGISSCGYWTDNRQKSRHASEFSQISWVQGFLSAFNVYSGGADISEGIDANGILAWMDDYCMKHPLEPIAVASGALIKELQRRGAQK